MPIVKVLGSGDSLGCPILSCGCMVCASDEPRNKRSRPSVAVFDDQSWFLIDCSPDLKTQTATFDYSNFQGALITHPHADHILGIEDLRGPAYVQKSTFKIYGSRDTLLEVYSRFMYRVSYLKKQNVQRPWDDVEAHEIEYFKPFKIGNFVVKPVLLYHGDMRVTGYKINDFAYCIDANSITEETIAELNGVQKLLLGAIWSDEVGPKTHDKHFTIEQAIELARSLNVGHLYLSHLSHLVDYPSQASKLPSWVSLCYDGMEIPI